MKPSGREGFSRLFCRLLGKWLEAVWRGDGGNLVWADEDLKQLNTTKNLARRRPAIHTPVLTVNRGLGPSYRWKKPVSGKLSPQG